MGELYASAVQPKFIMSLGDNFYMNGVRSLHDRKFNTTFENVYGRGALTHIPWQISLGDHDHCGNVSALLLHTQRSPRWRLPRPYYSFKLPRGPGRWPLEFFVLDSVGLEGGIARKHARLVRERRFAGQLSDEFAGRAAGEAQWHWIENALRQGSGCAPLRIVVGHRPIVSAANRSSTAAEQVVAARLRRLLLEASGCGRILYLSGHDHIMQHLSEEKGKLHYVGAGTGGFQRHRIVHPRPAELSWAADHTNGFVVHEMSDNAMVLRFIDASSGAMLHSVELSLVESDSIGTPLWRLSSSLILTLALAVLLVAFSIFVKCLEFQKPQPPLHSWQWAVSAVKC